MGTLRLYVSLLVVAPLLLFADADRNDWVGQYAMNHDGHQGTLRIMLAKCRYLPCTGLGIEYVDEHGAAFPGTVTALDENGQHLAFTIDFPGNRQPFNVYIFSFDKNKIAGTTVWGGRTFGVMATKAAAASEVAPYAKSLSKKSAILAAKQGMSVSGAAGSSSAGAATGTPTRVVLPDGTVEVHYPDGNVWSKMVGGCGWNIRRPDGGVIPAMCTRAAVIPIVPPPPPAGSPEESWLKGEDENLLEILQGVLGGSNSSNFQNYMNSYENPPEAVLYKRIFYRTRAISEFSTFPK